MSQQSYQDVKTGTISGNFQLIENNLEALGFIAKVTAVDEQEKYCVYHLELAVGTDLERLEKHDRDLALALASPTGKVYWQIPIPGERTVGLKVPKPSPEYLEKQKQLKGTLRVQNTWRGKIAFAFFMLGKLNYLIASTISGDNRRKDKSK